MLDDADVAVFASAGAVPAPGLLLGAIARGAVPVAARLPVYDEIIAEGEHGLLSEAGDVETLAAQLDRLMGDAGLRGRLRDTGRPLRLFRLPFSAMTTRYRRRGRPAA